MATDDARPNEHAVIAHVGGHEDVDALLTELQDRAGVSPDTVVHGSGSEFAERLEAVPEKVSNPATRVIMWLHSIGQEREELVRLGEHVREGRHGLVIHDVEARDVLDRIVEVLNDHGAEDIIYFGDWQTEDMSIRR